MAFKAVFIDMDGTLLRSDHTISPTTQEVLRDLQQRGIWVVPVSARPLHGILPITGPVISESNPVVSLNGSYIYHQGQIIHQVIINLDHARSVHEEIRDQEASVMYYSQMDWFATQDSPLIRKEQRITPVPIRIEPFDQILDQWRSQDNGPNKIMVGGDPDLVSSIEARLISLHRGTLNIYKSQPRFLEIMNRQASKKSALEFLLNRFGLDRKEAIAFGDNYNDQEMIAYAGLGVAMGNAPEAIKQSAAYITDTNNEDGVAKALRHFLG
ncbi:MAG TPA: Cof-type HAD-IIB family hydrolase [Chitinophagaceae bacterium]|nr:Cof-type HAD-IIB family hydrolase [Chitinophagaceae bacterium]